MVSHRTIIKKVVKRRRPRRKVKAPPREPSAVKE
jgi:hypothetical protein